MLTSEREAVIRKDFSDRLSDLGFANTSGEFEGRLPLQEAYAVLFTREEQEEYQLADFLQDAESSGPARFVVDRMSVDEALAFLEANQ